MSKHISRFFILLPFFVTAFGCAPRPLLPAGSDAAQNVGDLPPVEIQEIRAGVWLHTSYFRFDSGTVYPSNGIIVRDGEHLILIDPAWGARSTEQLLSLIQHEIGLPVQYAVATHFHGDRTLGVNVLADAGVKVFAHPMTLELAASNGNPVPEWGLPSLESEGSRGVLGSIELFYPGPGHAPDNIMVWLAHEKILYGGCAIREMSAETLGNVADADLASWRNAIKLAQSRYAEAEIVIPGHGEVGDSRIFDHMLNLFEAVP